MITSFIPAVLQLLVVVSPDWNAAQGTLYCFERPSVSSEWILSRSSVPVTLGKNGMAWGRGIHDSTDVQGNQKKEGDRRSPAGIFSLGTVFGNESHKSYARNMPFLLITDDLECVDDSDSIYYNQLVYSDAISSIDWKSSEKMKEIGFLYDLGLVIEHNLHPVQMGMGSAIFMHIWRGKGMGTLGCTAMEEKDLNEIVVWLDKEKLPCIVQMPLDEYFIKKAEWGLPDIPYQVEKR